MRVINLAKNGKEIKDLSKAEVPKYLQKQMIRIYYKPKKGADIHE